MSDIPIGDPRPAGEEGPAGDLRPAGEEGLAGDPRPAGGEAPGGTFNTDNVPDAAPEEDNEGGGSRPAKRATAKR